MCCRSIPCNAVRLERATAARQEVLVSTFAPNMRTSVRNPEVTQQLITGIVVPGCSPVSEALQTEASDTEAVPCTSLNDQDSTVDGSPCRLLKGSLV
jgi:hypothetical protein